MVAWYLVDSQNWALENKIIEVNKHALDQNYEGVNRCVSEKLCY